MTAAIFSGALSRLWLGKSGADRPVTNEMQASKRNGPRVGLNGTIAANR